MPLWLLITLLAHLANAVVFVVDKMLLGSRVKPKPAAYAFYSAIVGLAAFALVPFGGVDVPDGAGIILALLAGVAWLFALVVFFHALREGEASRVAPMVGSFVPLFTLLFAFLILGHTFTQMEILALVFLVGGAVVVSARRIRSVLTFHLLGVGAVAGALFAFSFVITDLLFETYPFISGIVWTRVAGFIAALFFLLIPSIRQSIVGARQRSTNEHALAFFANKGLAGLAVLGITYAISIGPVSFVNALQGVQYAFLFIVAVLLSWKFPQFLEEQRRGPVLVQKLVGIVIITLGLFLIH